MHLTENTIRKSFTFIERVTRVACTMACRLRYVHRIPEFICIYECTRLVHTIFRLISSIERAYNFAMFTFRFGVRIGQKKFELNGKLRFLLRTRTRSAGSVFNLQKRRRNSADHHVDKIAYTDRRKYERSGDTTVPAGGMRGAGETLSIHWTELILPKEGAISFVRAWTRDFRHGSEIFSGQIRIG